MIEKFKIDTPDWFITTLRPPIKRGNSLVLEADEFNEEHSFEFYSKDNEPLDFSFLIIENKIMSDTGRFSHMEYISSCQRIND